MARKTWIKTQRCDRLTGLEKEIDAMIRPPGPTPTFNQNSSAPFFRCIAAALVSFLVYLCLSSTAPSKELVLQADIGKYPLGNHVEYLVDEEKTLTIEDVSGGDAASLFRSPRQHVPSFGFTSSAIWFRVAIRNPFPEKHDFFLEVKNSYIDRVYFYKPDGLGGWSETKTGELLPFDTREIPRGTFIFQISVPRKSSEAFYLRFAGDSSFDLPVILYDYMGFQEEQYRRSVHMGFYFGIIFIMMVTSLFLFLQIRDNSLFYYFLYLAATALVFSNYKGVTEQYLWPDNPIWANQAFFVFYSLTHIFFLLFTRSFLDTPRHLGLLDRILLIEIFILLLCIVPGLFVPYQVGAQFLMLSVIVYQSTALLAGAACYMRGGKSAGYFLLAFTPIIVSTIIYILIKMNYLGSSKMIAEFFQINHFVKLSLLSIAIIARVKLLNDEKTQALERVNAVKDEFLARTSHELRTPLHGIIGIAESLIDKHTSHSLSQPVVKQLQVIMAAGKRLVSLVNDILDISKLKNRDIQLRRKPVDIYQLAEIVIALCAPLTIGKKLRLINDIPRNIPPVLGDEERLQQIMNNLLGNAIKFTDRGEVRVTAEEENGRVAVSVHDTGVGIPENQLDNIFVSFEQGDYPPGGYSQGTGLGLSIAKHLVKLHGGVIRVISEVGKGSVFSFDLQISPSPAEEKLDLEISLPVRELDDSDFPNDEIAAAAHQGSCYNILVVDDEPINLQVVAAHLNDHGYGVRTVASGEEALIEIGRDLPDLILLDVMMPKMSGFEVCRRIRQQYSKSKIIVIFLTAKNQVSDLVEGFAMGANDYLSKPFSKNELLTRVKYHLESSEMANRLLGLTEFSCRLSKLKDMKRVFQEAFDLIGKQLSADCGVLFHEEKVIAGFGSSAERLAAGHLVLDKPGSAEEISFHYLHATEVMLIRPRYFPDFEMMIVKEDHQMFSEVDVEYIKNVLTTIKVTRENIREIITDGRLLSGLHQIRENLKKVICIKAQRNYCVVACDDEEKSFELRIPIHKIQNFFNESELLKINRSTLINPLKVRSLQKVAKQKYAVLMVNGEELPISRLLMKQVRGFFERN